MTEKYAYCSTVPRTFVHDCRIPAGAVFTNSARYSLTSFIHSVVID